jgi:hypothetical protein
VILTTHLDTDERGLRILLERACVPSMRRQYYAPESAVSAKTLVGDEEITLTLRRRLLVR